MGCYLKKRRRRALGVLLLHKKIEEREIEEGLKEKCGLQFEERENASNDLWRRAAAEGRKIRKKKPSAR